MSAGSFKFKGQDSINPKDSVSISRLIDDILGKFSEESELIDQIRVEEINEREVVSYRIIFPSEILHLSHESERAKLCDLIADFCDAEEVNNVAVRLTFNDRPLEIFVNALSDYIEERFLDIVLFPSRGRGKDDDEEVDADARGLGGVETRNTTDHFGGVAALVGGEVVAEHAESEKEVDEEVNCTLSVGVVADDDPARNHWYMGGVADSIGFPMD